MAQDVLVLKIRHLCFLGPFCPTYNRELSTKGEAKEVIKGLEEQTRAVPAKVRRLEAKVARQSSRLEALHKIRPDLQMLKQLGRKVYEAEVRMKQLEKAVKVLQRELEVEEGEHGLTTLASRLRTLAGMALVCSSSPRITSSPLPFLASSLLPVEQGGTKKHKCQIVKTAKP